MKTNWLVKKLGEIIELRYGKGIAKEDRKIDGAYIIYGANGILGRTDKYLVEGKAIIVGRKGSAGEVTRVLGKFWPSDVTYYVFGNKEIDIDFLFYLFKNIDLKRFAKGIKPGINRNDIYNLEIPVPSIEEQRKIVKKLEKILAKIEKTRTFRQDSTEETSVVILKKLEEIFSQYSKYKIQKVQDIAEVGTGATPLRGRTNYYGGAIPWVTSGATSEPYITEADEYITELALKETNCKINKKHSLVIAMYGEGKTRGQVSELLIEAATNQACATISVNKDIANQRFVKYFFELNYKKTRELSRGGPQSNLNLTRIKNIELPVPKIKEQEKIVAYLDGLGEKVQALQKLQQEQLQDLEALQKSVLHQAFQGEL